jgi:hypothetical protein
MFIGDDRKSEMAVARGVADQTYRISDHLQTGSNMSSEGDTTTGQKSLIHTHSGTASAHQNKACRVPGPGHERIVPFDSRGYALIHAMRV